MTKKRVRANGEGSIFRRASDQMWVGALHLPSGRRKAVYGKTKAAVVEKLERLKSDIVMGGVPKSDERESVEEYLTEWFATVRPKLRPKSERTYESILRNHIIPNLGKRRFTKLTPHELEQFFSKLVGTGLSPSTVRLIKTVLSTACADALRWGRIARNPVTPAVSPKVVKRDGLAIEPTEARNIRAAFVGQPMEHLVSVALGSGLRQGELLGLTWADIDFDAGTVIVRATLHYLNGKYERMQPKTSRSNRLIPIAPFALEALRLQRESQTAHRLVADRWQNDMNLVFTGDTGQPLSEGNVRKTFVKGLATAGLPRRRFHEMRHAYATLLLAQGVDITTIMEMLGHTNLHTSLIYTHVVSELKRDAARKLDELLG